MNDFKLIFEKLKTASLDKGAMVNNTVLFLIAWITAYWVFNFFTIIPAFSMGVKMLVYNSFIDFNSVNTAASDKNLWSSADNINNMFFTPVIFSVILALTATLFLIKWNSDRLNIRRFLFWLILCIIIRVNGNFMFGHIFNLWSWNLVTDFMGLTYPSMFLKYLSVVIIFIVTAFLFVMMMKEIKKLFNPYLSNRFDSILSNIFYPVLLGGGILIIWNLPYLPANEICCILLMLLMTVFFMCRPFLRLYRGIAQGGNEEDLEQVNAAPIIILGVLLVINIVLMFGIMIETSAYRFYFVENFIMGFIIVLALATLIISVRVYNRRMNARKLAWQMKIREIDYINQQQRTSGNEDWTTGSKINLDKYKDSFNEGEVQNDDASPKIDFANSEKYGFKRYNLKNYNQRNW